MAPALPVFLCLTILLLLRHLIRGHVDSFSILILLSLTPALASNSNTN